MIRRDRRLRVTVIYILLGLFRDGGDRRVEIAKTPYNKSERKVQQILFVLGESHEDGDYSLSVGYRTPPSGLLTLFSVSVKPGLAQLDSILCWASCIQCVGQTQVYKAPANRGPKVTVPKTQHSTYATNNRARWRTTMKKIWTNQPSNRRLTKLSEKPI